MDAKEKRKEYYQKNKQKAIEYYQKNKERIKDYYKSNKDHIKEYSINNRKKHLEYEKKYREKNKKKINDYYKDNKQKYKEYYNNNKKIILERQKIYTSKNKEKINEYRRKIFLEKYNLDLNFKIKCVLRSRFRIALKYGYKSDSIINLIGCSIEELKKYLENKFKEGMTWENHDMNGWHIDHIIPCVSFDLTDPEQQKKCFHYSNLQPLWAKENLIKGSSF
jgi:hypothetical protein